MSNVVGYNPDAGLMATSKSRYTVKDLMDAATPVNIHGVFDELRDYRQNGYPKGHSTGWRRFDEFYVFPPFGQLNIITGAPSSGKTEWIDSLAMNAARMHNWRILYYSPENTPASFHVEKLAEKFYGKNMFAQYSGVSKITDQEINDFERFLMDHFNFIDCDGEFYSMEQIRKAVVLWESSGKVDMIVVDPWNNVDYDMEKHESETQFIRRELRKTKSFVHRKGIHLFIVAHPKKPIQTKDGGYAEITPYSTSDSAHWYNMADNFFVFHRSKEERDANDPVLHCDVWKIKNRRYGGFGKFDFYFNHATGDFRDEM